MRSPQCTARGISLIEAVVALAVMAFGMLAYVGLQSSLRFNSDVAKQRAEGVRIAQQAIEDWRAYARIEPAADITDYADLATLGPTTITPADSNTVFTLNRTVTPAGTRPDAPPMKTLVADVSWQDRNGETQRVRLSTTIAASPPELAGTLAVPAFVGALHQPLGRSPAIPVVARDLGNGTSAFKPPGSSGGSVLWVFDNLTGVIVGVCNTVTTDQDDLTQADTQACINSTTGSGLSLSGYVRFSTAFAQPTAADAEQPASTARNLEVALTLTGTGHPSPTAYACYSNAPTSSPTSRRTVRYYCVILFNAGVTPAWSGTSTLTPLAFLEPAGDVAWQIAGDAADAKADRFRVCRYTPATSDSQAIPNTLHPRTYIHVSVDEPLTNQNFLVIRAGTDLGDGNGGTAFTCPPDGPADPAIGDLVNSNTLVHQPAPSTPTTPTTP